MPDMKEAPTPWIADGIFIKDAQDRHVCLVGGPRSSGDTLTPAQQLEIAAFIVQAVNAHSALVKALEECAFVVRKRVHCAACGIRTTDHCTTPSKCQQVASALALAKGESHAS